MMMIIVLLFVTEMYVYFLGKLIYATARKISPKRKAALMKEARRIQRDREFKYILDQGL